MGSLSQGEFTRLDGTAMPHAFQLTTRSNDDDATPQTSNFACETEEECKEWETNIQRASRMETVQTMHLGGAYAQELAQFRLKVTNRRQKIADPACLNPVFKANLYKLKTEGNPLNPEEWFLRETWLAENGSLVYHSVKSDSDLVYYTSADVAKASVCKVAKEKSAMEFTFQVNLAPVDGIEYAPGLFAAEAAAMRDQWMEQFTRIAEGHVASEPAVQS
eukprot:NODE_1781_length_1063_cov_442.270833.p1 GENE.NODE_1781_length_1063_cov_442.270833~~NODE_1781_length_1063_cov_442.270833.p1  ORF type:complete len:219 (-),score=52.95 NODE_1781_length_1063_cov_442.270833:389-1045(-)